MTLIGISAITISLMYYLLARHFNPVLLEYSIFNIGHMKLLTQFTFRGEVDLPVFSVGNIAIIGSAFLLSDQRNLNNKNDIIFILLALLVGFVLVNASGQRQYYIILFLIITSLLFTKSKNNTLIIFLFLLIIVVLFSVVMIGLSIDLPFITSMFYNSYSLEEMVNRKTNWDAAIYLIKENIFTGIGFGGYYIPGYSFSGSGTYAHNLVLEVFSEMGLIGLAIFIIFPVFIILSNLDSFLNHKFLNGANYLPIFVVYLSQSMISFDLSKNAPLFSIFLLYYSYSKK